MNTVAKKLLMTRSPIPAFLLLERYCRLTVRISLTLVIFLTACAQKHVEAVNTLCQEGLTREGAACGLNARGHQPQKCIDGLWVDYGACVDPDKCTEDDTSMSAEGCGINGNGLTPLKCMNGQWVESDQCHDPDVCVNGKTQQVACGYNNNGKLAQKCVDGQWVDDGACVDPDECKNGTWKTEEGIVSECVEGKWVLRRTTRQWGTEMVDKGYGVAVDASGNIFVAGDTRGSLDGNVNAYDCINLGFSCTADIFLTKWNADGTKAWTKQWGTTALDYGYTVAVDGNGNIFVAGTTRSSLDGNVNAEGACEDPTAPCNTDIFLTKWNADGTKAWTRQWGTAAPDQVNALAVDTAGNIFVTGMMLDFIDGNTNEGVDCDLGVEGIQPCAPIFLTRWNTDGAYAWTKQWGSYTFDWGAGVTVDTSGNVYVTGGTSGDLDGNTCLENTPGNCSCDIFLTKLTGDGTTVWTKQWGTTGSDSGKAVAIDSVGDIIVTGNADGPLDDNMPTEANALFLTKWNSSGGKKWTQQWGSLQGDRSTSVAVAPDDHIIVTGSTTGSFDAFTNAGGADIFITKWDPTGATNIWTQQWGTEKNESAQSVVVGTTGKIFVAGWAEGSLDGNVNAGGDCDPREETSCGDIFLTILPAE